jgi:hypothetical protein
MPSVNLLTGTVSEGSWDDRQSLALALAIARTHLTHEESWDQESSTYTTNYIRIVHFDKTIPDHMKMVVYMAASSGYSEWHDWIVAVIRTFDPRNQILAKLKVGNTPIPVWSYTNHDFED